MSRSESSAPATEVLVDATSEEAIAAAKAHMRIGQTVMILTRGYHWLGRLRDVTALRLVLDQATLFVDVGQIDKFARGDLSDSDIHGRSFPPAALVKVDAIGAEVADWPYELPTRPIGS